MSAVFREMTYKDLAKRLRKGRKMEKEAEWRAGAEGSTYKTPLFWLERTASQRWAINSPVPWGTH